MRKRRTVDKRVSKVQKPLRSWRIIEIAKKGGTSPRTRRLTLMLDPAGD